MDDQYCLLTPNFDLPDDLYLRLITDIGTQNFRGNFRSLIQQLYLFGLHQEVEKCLINRISKLMD